MIAYYAMGAGLGHVSRALAVKKALNLPDACLLIHNSQYLQQGEQGSVVNQAMRVFDTLVAEVSLLHTPVAFKRWLLQTLASRGVQTLYIDTFGVGIKGELNGLSSQCHNIRLMHIARALKWPEYSALVNQSNHFQHSYIVEPLAEPHEQYLRQHSQSVSNLSLPLPEPAQCTTAEPAMLPTHPFCLVIHAGSDEEMEVLLEYAKDKMRCSGKILPMVLCSPRAPAVPGGVVHVKCYPATRLLQRATVVVSAAGFNTIEQMRALRKQHWVLPMPRRYDDQFHRAEHYRKSLQRLSTSDQ